MRRPISNCTWGYPTGENRRVSIRYTKGSRMLYLRAYIKEHFSKESRQVQLRSALIYKRRAHLSLGKLSKL
jgi:hypothetical protein